MTAYRAGESSHYKQAAQGILRTKQQDQIQSGVCSIRAQSSTQVTVSGLHLAVNNRQASSQPHVRILCYGEPIPQDQALSSLDQPL